MVILRDLVERINAHFEQFAEDDFQEEEIFDRADSSSNWDLKNLLETAREIILKSEGAAWCHVTIEENSAGNREYSILVLMVEKTDLNKLFRFKNTLAKCAPPF